ncbi:hypothetical protein CROQUDRAFT_672589 [Cronartium quercuum f. sp. fusiforme G11]|uniref:Uncharacterized protein n=1 Tax=Cronartium quercuum f. sp. fusiforme G11 TaxID=708437 RepID=A0A9P6T9W5_9BASI|nr:hypothetical protein CROQUDRAFT_672589 [Cronartium quercuum f. sp. fusiforme G11]
MSTASIHTEPELTAGSSSNLFFKKKRKQPTNLRSRSTLPLDQPPSSTTNPDSTPLDSSDEQASDTASTIPTIDDIIALRKLKKARGGIDLERLNAGEPKKKRKKRGTKTAADPVDDPSVEDNELQSEEIQKDDRLDEDEPEDEDARTRKIIKSNNFTQQTNTLDVDKHMMRYIEEELKQRRKAAIDAGADASSEPILTGVEAVASLDPRDELYKIAEKYRIDKKPVVEGNVTLSATMLTSIPEVDLGIDTRIKNIEATEKAKRKLADERMSNLQSTGGVKPSASTSEHFAADRFLLPNHLKQNHWASEIDSLKIARLENEGMSAEAEAMRKDLKKRAYQLKYGNNAHNSGHRTYGAKSAQVATDDRAVENFRKRMGGRR